MVRLLLGTLVGMLFFCSAGAALAKGAASGVERQEIAVTLEPETHRLVGTCILILAPGTERVSLRLSATATIDSVSVEGERVPFSWAGGLLSLELPRNRGAVTVGVSYRAVFNDQVSRSPAAGEDPSYGVNGAITREGTFLGGGAYWYPVPQQTPDRRSVSIRAPAGTEALTGGRRVSRETVGTVTRSVWEEARPIGVLSLAAGPYQIEQRQVNGIDLYTYFYPDNAQLSGKYLDAAAKYLTFYSDLFGPYPFEKFAVVENFFPTGYGLPSFTLLGGSVIRLPFIIDTSFPHEIAHSWWGNGIDVDPREGNWCEGLVTYLADYLLKERRSAAEGADYRRQLLVDYASLVTPANDFPLNAFQSRSDPASRTIGYGKGAMVFHMVRTRIGDRAFFAALRQLCRDHLYGEASWSDFVGAFSRSSGQDLAPFMKQWLTRTGGPRLSLSGVTSRKDATGWTVSGTIVQAAPFFELAVPLRLEGAGAPVREAVPLQGERTRFSIASAREPGRLLLDPDADIFRILAPGEIPATVNSLKGASKLVGVMTENCRAKRETFQRLLGSLSQGGATVVSEGELDAREAGRHDLIFCGVPQNGKLLPTFPEGVRVSAAEFSLGGERFFAPDALLLLVMPQVGGRGVTALYQPLSEAAAVQYGPKITHYGKYGYLAFSAGSIRLKGTHAPPDAGVAVNLKP